MRILNIQKHSLFNRWLMLLACMVLFPYSLLAYEDYEDIVASFNNDVKIKVRVEGSTVTILGPVDRNISYIYIDRAGLELYRGGTYLGFYKITSIAADAFKDCKNLKYFSSEASITSIGDRAFQGCSNLSYYEWTNNLKSIGSNAFSGCTSLSAVHFSDKLESIADSAFSGCTSLSNIHFPDNLKSIGSNAFQYCEALREVELPKGLTSIESEAFQNCI